MDRGNPSKVAENMDQEALSVVFDQYAPLLFRYALRLCRDPEEADHIVGDVFSKLLDQLTIGKGPHDNLRSYLYQATYHLIVDYSREFKHHSSLENSLYGQADDPSVEDQAEDSRKLTLLQETINSVLTDDQRHVIVLRFLEGFNLRETAAILGKEVNNIKVIQNRAISKLREALGEEFED